MLAEHIPGFLQIFIEIIEDSNYPSRTDYTLQFSVLVLVIQQVLIDDIISHQPVTSIWIN